MERVSRPLPDAPQVAPGCRCWFGRFGPAVEQDLLLPVVPDAAPDAADSARKNAESLYQPLKPWQTRIVTIWSAKSSEPLRCSLWTAELIDKPGVAVSGTSDIVGYKALSYSWGLDHRAPTKLIICNEMPILVNSSLASALLDIREEVEDVRIWCDALCINQSDPVEKAQQVRNMLRIFEKAELVIAWIGLPDTGTKHLFRALEDKEDGLSPNHTLHSPLAIEPKDSIRHNLICFQTAVSLAKTAHDHLRRPWFRRTWLRQEVFGTSHLFIHSGGYTISFADFVTATQLILKSSQRLLSENTSLIKEFTYAEPERFRTRAIKTVVPASVSVLQKSYEHAGTDRHEYEPPRQRLRYSAHWLRVLNQGTAFEVTDPRDKVYGVLGIITSPTTKLYVESRPDIQRAEFPISYTKSVSEVYQDVVKHLINLDRNLDVLQIFEDRCHRPKDLPSWVTDWRQSTKRSVIQCPPEEKPRGLPLGLAPIQKLDDVGKLRLYGVQVGGPLKGINVRSNGDLGILSPELQSMDSNYVKVAASESFVWGTNNFGFDRNLLTGKPQSPAEYSDPSSTMQERTRSVMRQPQPRAASTSPSYKMRETMMSVYSRFHAMEVSTDAMEVSTESRILIPREAKLDDILVALLGSSCLFLLRPLPWGEYEFLGPVIRSVGDLPNWSKVKKRTFVLV